MPLVTRVTRDGQALTLRWGWFHVNAMCDVAAQESGDPHCLGVKGRWVAQQRHEFTDEADGEVFVIEPGDVLEMWREV